MGADPSSVRGFAGPITASLHGQRKEATDSLSLSAFTMALCHTLLYFPLLTAYNHTNLSATLC